MPLSAWLCVLSLLWLCVLVVVMRAGRGFSPPPHADMACGRACMVAVLTGAVRRLVSPMLCLPQSRSVCLVQAGVQRQHHVYAYHHMSRLKDCVPAVHPQALSLTGDVDTECP